jgi:hypothetical protein
MLLVVGYVCFSLAALGNIDYPLFPVVVRCVVIATVAASVYRCWADKGPPRAFHVGFVVSAVLYLSIVALIAYRCRFNGPIYVFEPVRELLLPQGIAYIPWVAATFDRAAHYLASLLVGLLGGSVAAYCYSNWQRMLLHRQ